MQIDELNILQLKLEKGNKEIDERKTVKTFNKNKLGFFLNYC